MSQILSKTKRQIPLLILLGIFALLGIIYYFAYIPGKERRLNEQHFRWLQNIDANIRTKVAEKDTLLRGLMQIYDCGSSQEINKQYFTKINDIGTINATTIPVVPDHNDTTYNEKKATKDSFMNEDEFSIDADSSIKEISFILYRRKDKLSYRCITNRCDFADFVKPLLPQSIFDHYVIFYNGNYIYEDFHSGLTYKNEDSLLMDNRSKTISSSTIIRQQVGGVDYRMFFQPIIIGNKKLIIAGLHSSERFDREERSMPEEFVTVSFIIALGLFLIIPLLRILFMGKYDRLQLKNVFWAGIVAKLLMSVLFLFFFCFQSPFKESKMEESVDYIQNKVCTNFNRDIAGAYNELNRYDSIKSQKKLGDYVYITNLGADSMNCVRGKRECPYVDQSNFAGDSAVHFYHTNFPVREINWLSKNGTVLSNWTIKNYNTIQTNYKDRNYFKDALFDNNLAYLPNKDSFALDQVISRNSGEFCTVIAKKKQADTIIAMAFDLKCMDSVILPLGYSILIADNNGLVRYHSQADKNLTENVFDELSNQSREDLTSAVKGRFKLHFKATYYEENYDVWMAPLKNYPYYIIVMRDRSLIDSVNIQTFVFSLSMMLLFLILAIIDIAVLVFTSSRRSPFKKQFFVTSWLWPRQTSKVEYVKAVICNAAIILVLLIIYWTDITSFLQFTFILIITPPALTLFLNLLFWKKYSKQQTYYRRFKVYCSRGLISLLIIYLILAGVFLQKEMLAVLRYLLLIASGLFLFFLWNLNNSSKAEDEEGNRYITWYTAMIFTRMVITSGIPMMFFYVNAFNYEQNLMVRISQVNMMQQMEKQHLKIDLIDSREGIYKDNAEIASIRDSVPYDKSDSLNNTEQITADIFNAFGLYFGSLPFENDDFYQTNSGDSSIKYNNILKNGAASATFVPVRNKPNEYSLVSSNAEKTLYHSPNLQSGWLFWAAFLTALSLLFFGLLLIIKRVFSKDVLYVDIFNGVNKDLIAGRIHNELSIVVTVVDEYISEYGNLIKPKPASNYVDFNELHMSDTEEGVSRNWKLTEQHAKNIDRDQALYLFHFEEDFSDITLVKRKITFLEDLLRVRKTIVMVTEKHPIIIAEKMHRMNASNDDVTKEMLISRLDSLLGKFITIVHPLKQFKNATKISDDLLASEMLQPHIDYETKDTFFLRKLAGSIKVDDTKHDDILCDTITLKIQAIAHNFYKRLWHSLTENEKFVLYDLAEDGLVNTKNMFSLNMLISRGIIRLGDGGLHVFNRSFRNFVVSSIGKQELEKLNHRHNQDSRWGKLNGLLIFSGIAILVFLGITQDSAFTKAIGTIAALTSGLTVVIKLLDMIASKNNKPKSDITPAPLVS